MLYALHLFELNRYRSRGCPRNRINWRMAAEPAGAG